MILSKLFITSVVNRIKISTQFIELLYIVYLFPASLPQGLIQIEMLKTIEQMTGKSITDMFDWIVGTSIGAILALGVIYGESGDLYT